MGIFRRESPEGPGGGGRSIRFTFALMVGLPAGCLVVLWVLALAGALSAKLPWHSLLGDSQPDAVRFALLLGAGLAVVLLSAVLVAVFARRLTHDVSDLAAEARRLAEQEMPRLVERIRQGEQPLAGEAAAPLPRTKVAEVGRVAAAIARLQQAAVAAAAGEASMRSGVGQVFVSLARRNQSLLQRQLRLIDALEQKASDPAALADLFPLDHLTTRMRRHAEGLIILSGAAPGRSWSEPVPVIDVVRGAVAEVEDYQRVNVLTRAEDAVAGAAVADVVHLLAELIENATLFSPSGTRVEVRAERVANGFAVEIDDRGLGIKPAQLEAINQRLVTPPDFDLANADQLGLFVVGKLAARHGIRVMLRASPYGGTTAIVLMPNSIVVPVAEAAALPGRPAPRPAAEPAPAPRLVPDAADGTDRPAALAGGTAGEALALTGPSPRHAAAGADGTPPDGFERPPDGGTYRGLPRRVRQASLSPQLREGRPAEADGNGEPGASERSPEEARDLVASLQSGWQRGRQEDSQDAEQPDGPDSQPDAGGSEEE